MKDRCTFLSQQGGGCFKFESERCHEGCHHVHKCLSFTEQGDSRHCHTSAQVGRPIGPVGAPEIASEP